MVKLIQARALYPEIVMRLPQFKRNNNILRPVICEKRARIIKLGLQPDLKTARRCVFGLVCLESSRTHDAAVLSEKKPASIIQPADFILGSMKWPQSRDQN